MAGSEVVLPMPTGFFYVTILLIMAQARKRTRSEWVTSKKSSRSQGTQTSGQTATFRKANRRHPAGPKKSGNLKQQVASLQKVVRQILPEIKNATIDLAQTNITSSGTITHLTAIGAGTGESERIGEDVTIRSIICKGYFTIMDGATPAVVGARYYRFAVIQDKQQIGDTSSTLTTAFSTSDPVLALPSLSFADRYRYLWVSPLIAGYAVITGNQFAVCNWSWSGTIPVGYNGTASTDITKNGLYFCILTTDNANALDFTGTARVSYTDS